MLGRSIRKNSTILAGFAAMTAGLIAITFQATAGRIADAERRAAQQALFEVVPQSRHNNDLLSDTLVVSAADAAALHMSDPALIHVARQDGEPVALLISSSAPDGYSGAIKFLVGINVDGSIAGVRVLKHAETPGLGDKIELAKNPWILGFDGKSLTNPTVENWSVKKDGGDFDQFAGATITPRAVVKQTRQVLQYVQEHREELFEKARANPTIAPSP
jgi:electron transport complex protein RnfG